MNAMTPRRQDSELFGVQALACFVRSTSFGLLFSYSSLKAGLRTLASWRLGVHFILLGTAFILSAAIVSTDVHAAPPGETLLAWSVDSMQKVFKDEMPPATPTELITIDAARNEVVSAQIVLRCDEPMENLLCRVAPLTSETKDQTLPTLRVRYVGYVAVNNKSPGYQLRPRPCDYPDPLFDEPPATVPARTAQPIWLTFKIPPTAAPGLYHGSAEIQATIKGSIQKTSVPLTIQVYSATLSEKRTLKISNWFWFDTPQVTKFCGVDELYSEPFWKLMEAVARDMADHRQNVIFTPVTAWTWLQNDPAAGQDLITAKAGQDNQLEFDFSRFDRWVQIFQAAGGNDVLIEGSQLAKAKRGQPYHSVLWTLENGKAVRRVVESTSPEYDKYLSIFLPAFQAHLKERGWFEHYIQHILDEPNTQRNPTYVTVAGYFKKYAPNIKTIDALMTTDLVGSVDIWVPLRGTLLHNTGFFKERQAKGEELWFYTTGRPVEWPLVCPRLLQWMNYSTGTTGYLHWGYNWWVRTKDPFSKWTLAPGDEWIVYPKKGGVYDSLRYESMLEGIQDYELLKALSSRDAKAADAICHQLDAVPIAAPREGDYDNAIPTLRSARRDLLKALSDR